MTRKWLDEPLAQWVYVARDHRDWCVMVGGRARARFTTRAEAADMARKIKEACGADLIGKAKRDA